MVTNHRFIFALKCLVSFTPVYNFVQPSHVHASILRLDYICIANKNEKLAVLKSINWLI